MIAFPLLAPRTPRAPQVKTAAQASDAQTDPATQAQENALATQRQAFDIGAEQQAELERERQALEQLMIARLKDEDEIMKKFIELI